MRNQLATQPLFELAHAGTARVPLSGQRRPREAARRADSRRPSSARNAPPLPELAEPDVIRHFVNLSTLNMSVDTHFYPLGSCTMKYNPKRHERLARLAGHRRPASLSNRARFAGHAADAVRAAADAGRDLGPAGRHAATGGRSAGRIDGTPRGGGLLPRQGRNAHARAVPGKRPRHQSRERRPGRLRVRPAQGEQDGTGRSRRAEDAARREDGRVHDHQPEYSGPLRDRRSRRSPSCCTTSAAWSISTAPT